MDIIQFQNQEFKVREIEFLKLGLVLISTNSLNKLLVNESGGYVSDEASIIDERIFYFVDEEDIELDNNKLISLLISNIK